MFRIVQLKFISRVEKMASDGTYCVACRVVLRRGKIGVFVLPVYDCMSQNGRLNHTAAVDKIIS
jgi:hypothetical protein